MSHNIKDILVYETQDKIEITFCDGTVKKFDCTHKGKFVSIYDKEGE